MAWDSRKSKKKKKKDRKKMTNFINVHILMHQLPVYFVIALFADPVHVKWLAEGCVTSQRGVEHTECFCNHLTYFSVLVVRHSTFIFERRGDCICVLTPTTFFAFLSTQTNSLPYAVCVV